MTTQCTQTCSKSTTNIDFGRKKNVFKFTSNIMLSFMDSQYQCRTMQTGQWDSAKGDHDHLKEVKIIINKRQQFPIFENQLLNTR